MNKKIVFLSIAIITFCGMVEASMFQSQKFQKPKALCVGNIVFPEAIDPSLSLYYKGDKLQLDVEGNSFVDRVPFSLVEEKSTQQLNILISQEVGFSTFDNTVQYLHVPETIAYKFYTLSAARDYDKNGEFRGYMWDIKECSLGSKRVAPDNTMFFLFDPQFVESLEVRTWVQDNNTRLLPDIYIKKTASFDELIRTIAISRLAAMDMDTLHHHNFEMKKQKSSQAIAMMVL